MTVVLESLKLRQIAHKLLDDVLDYAEALAEEWRLAAGPGLPESGLLRQPATGKPRITLEPPAKKAPAAKPAPPAPHQYPDVTVSCRSSCSRLEIAVNLSAQVAKRLGLKPLGKATADLHRGKLRLRASKEGRAVYSAGGGSGRLFFVTLAGVFGITEKHAAESCTFHYDLEDALLIEAPAWLKWTAPAMPPPKRGEQKPKANPPMSCKKMHGTNPTIKCAACKTATATVECNRCPTLLCDACWEDHVRTHWHSNHKGKAATAARDARQAMRSGA